MIPLRFNFKDVADLNEDLRHSPKALNAIARRVLTLQLRKVRNELRPQVPVGMGKLRASLGSSIRKSKDSRGIWAVFGFLRSKKISASTAIAANVLQHPGATAKKRELLWIPTLNNRSAAGGAQITPTQFFAMPGTFISQTGAGNKMAFQRTGDTLVPLFVLKKSVRLSRPPLPIEARVEAAMPDLTADLQATFAQVLEARGAALKSLNVDG